MVDSGPLSLSALVLTYNEEEYVGRSLSSLVDLATEIIVIDSFSTDKTAEVCAEFQTVQFVQHPFVNFSTQRNYAIACATQEWILFIDADEEILPELAREIKEVITDGEKPHKGYWIPRWNIFWGKTVRHTGWSPDYQLRLFRREAGKYDATRAVHELVELEGSAGHLEGRIKHLNYATFKEFWQKQYSYTTFEVEMLQREGKRARPHNLLLQPLRQFRWRFITLKGYKDGWLGFVLSMSMAYFELIKYGKLYQRKYPRG